MKRISGKARSSISPSPVASVRLAATGVGTTFADFANRSNGFPGFEAFRPDSMKLEARQDSGEIRRGKRAGRRVASTHARTGVTLGERRAVPVVFTRTAGQPAGGGPALALEKFGPRTAVALLFTRAVGDADEHVVAVAALLPGLAHVVDAHPPVAVLRFRAI